PPLERDVESSPDGLEHAQALGHRFLADPVAGNDGDPIRVHRRLLHCSILTTPHPSGLWRPRTDFSKVTYEQAKKREPSFRCKPSFLSSSGAVSMIRGLYQITLVALQVALLVQIAPPLAQA